MSHRALRAVVAAAALLATLTAIAPAATAAWGAGGTGSAQGKAGVMVKPTVSWEASHCKSNNPNRKITLSISGLAPENGRVDIARSTTRGGQSFDRPLVTATFTASTFSYADEGSISVDTSYYYAVRVRPPGGDRWSVISDEVEALCKS